MASTAELIKKYSAQKDKNVSAVCEALRKEIIKAMPKGSGRIYYGMPAWLMDGNPVVAYRAASKHVLVLFWSWQSFKTPGLEPAGKFKAAEVRYAVPGDIDVKKLRAWLKESKKIIWNYRDLRKNRGRLEKI